MNVAETMRKAIPEFNEGFDGNRLHLTPEVEENWNENYAIVQGLWYTAGPFDNNDYFDHDRFRADVEKKVVSTFPGCKVIFNWRSQEIEVQKLPTKEQEAALDELAKQAQELNMGY
jgi:hypothetical protein